MKVTTPHIVNKVTVQIPGVPVDKVFRLRHQMEDFMKNNFSGSLENLLDVYSSEENIYIDKLFVEVRAGSGGFDPKEFEKLLILSVEKELNSAIVKPVKRNMQNGEKPAVSLSHNRALQFYLKNGVLPWWYPVKSWESFQANLMKEFQKQGSSFPGPGFFFSDKDCVTRFVYHFDEKLIKIVLANWIHADNLYSGVKKMVVMLKKEFPFLSQFRQITGTVFQKELLVYFMNTAFLQNEKQAAVSMEQAFGQTEKIPALQHLIQFIKEKTGIILTESQNEPVNKFLFKNNAVNESQKGKQEQIPEQQSEKINAKNEQVYFVQNAGIVLLHPFLPALFQYCNITAEDEKTLSDPYKALQILAFLGDSPAEEFAQPLNKVLTGIPLQGPVVHLSPLTKKEKELCTEMLEQAKNHWPSLKDSSVQALQQTFLQRPGKLTVTENNMVLNVESKTVDILMNTLPLGVSMIKLPWMERILTIEWTTN